MERSTWQCLEDSNRVCCPLKDKKNHGLPFATRNWVLLWFFQNKTCVQEILLSSCYSSIFIIQVLLLGQKVCREDIGVIVNWHCFKDHFVTSFTHNSCAIQSVLIHRRIKFALSPILRNKKKMKEINLTCIVILVRSPNWVPLKFGIPALPLLISNSFLSDFSSWKDWNGWDTDTTRQTVNLCKGKTSVCACNAIYSNLCKTLLYLIFCSDEILWHSKLFS